MGVWGITEGMREHFDLDPGLIYLNSGSHSIVPRSVQRAWKAELEAYEKNPTAGLFGGWKRLWAVQSDLARFFGAEPGDLFLRVNVTEVLNQFILGMPLEPGLALALSDLEYGAIANTVRFRAERDGRPMHLIQMPATPEEVAGLTQASLMQQLENQLRAAHATKPIGMLVVSDVMTGTGLLLPLDQLSRLTRSMGILLVVDGAHGPGSRELDFSKLPDLDFYAGNLHKWVMAPKGTSFGWVHPRHQAALEPIMAGWTTFECSEAFREFGGGNRFQERMLAAGCRDFSAWYAIQATLEFWREQGPERILTRQRELQTMLEGLVERELGWPCLTPADPDLRGPLLTYVIPARQAEKGFALMRGLAEQHGLQVSMTCVKGAWRLRLSPHVYNSEAECARAVEILKATVGNR